MNARWAIQKGRWVAVLVGLAPLLLPIFAFSAPQSDLTLKRLDGAATVYGAKIHYVEAGTGAPVILIHGLGDDTEVWTQVIPALARRFHVVALDQVGFGRSDKPLLNYRVSTFVDFLNGFLDQLKIDHASLVGNSFGGWVAAAFTIQHPQRVDRLVLADSAGYLALAQTMDKRTLSALKLASLNDIRYLGPLTFYDKRFYEEPTVQAAFTQRITAGDSYTIGQVLDSMIHGEDVLDHRLGRIEQPTLLLWGREDKLIPLRFAERFHREIAGSQLHVIDNCGHMPQVECPAAFSTTVIQFLGGVK